MDGTDILQHFTPLDRSVLESGDVYADYFEHLHTAFTKVMQGFNERTVDTPMEAEVVRAFIQRFLNTIEAFRMKYRFEDEQFMRIDLTESSFPNHIEFRELSADYGARLERLASLPDAETLQQGILDFLFRNRKQPVRLMRQMSKRRYYEMLHPDQLFMEFSPGDLVSLKDVVTEPRRFLYSWGSYDAITNRPLVYMLIFDQDYNSAPIDKDPVFFARFQSQLSKDAVNAAPLRVIASDIDTNFDTLHPKVLKRIDLGPLYGRYVKDEHPISVALRNHFETEDFAFAWTTEIIFSIGETRSQGFLSKGELKQIFFIDQTNAETMERHVSEIRRHLVASHDLVQVLHERHPELLAELSTPPMTFT